MNKAKEMGLKLYRMTTPIHDDDEYQQSIWMAIGSIIAELDDVVEKSAKGDHVQSASGAEFDMWGDLTGIDGLPEEEKRSLILSYIRSNPTITKSVFEKIVSSWSGGRAMATEIIDKYHVDVEFLDPYKLLNNVDDISWLIRQTLPAHLTYDVNAKQKESLKLATFSGSGEAVTVYPYYNDDIVNVGQYKYASALYSEEFITINNEVVNNE